MSIPQGDAPHSTKLPGLQELHRAWLTVPTAPTSPSMRRTPPPPPPSRDNLNNRVEGVVGLFRASIEKPMTFSGDMGT
jgi:hypothetical protein